MRLSLRGAASGIAHSEIVETPGEELFNQLALELFSLQFVDNLAYQRICEAQGIEPGKVLHWTQIPAVPTCAFKDLVISCLPPEERSTVFLSSGTTAQRPSRHFHSKKSLGMYEESLLLWFKMQLPRSMDIPPASSETLWSPTFVALTPSKAAAPHSSLVHMFETVARSGKVTDSRFVGSVCEDGSWQLHWPEVWSCLEEANGSQNPVLLVGTAFFFVYLMDAMGEQQQRKFKLPEGSLVLETGGYKGRSRSLSKIELHSLISQRLGVPPRQIVCEYGMAELSSQAYDTDPDCTNALRHFRFPPWARVQILSPETGCEVPEGGTGIIRIFDLANVYSVLAIQTEDLGIRRGAGFELLGRSGHSEARGCSLMSLSS